MESRQLEYERAIGKHRRPRRLLALGAAMSLALVGVAAGGQADHFGSCFECFRLADRWDYFAYGFVIGGHWLFWHDLAAVALVLPLVWLVVMTVDRRRRRR